jgi:hypothetical protein
LSEIGARNYRQSLVQAWYRPPRLVAAALVLLIRQLAC